jgi:hypothetical protein
MVPWLPFLCLNKSRWRTCLRLSNFFFYFRPSDICCSSVIFDLGLFDLLLLLTLGYLLFSYIRPQRLLIIRWGFWRRLFNSSLNFRGILGPSERERDRDGKGVLVYVASLPKTRHGCHYQLSTTKVTTRVDNMSHFTMFFKRIVWLTRFAFYKNLIVNLMIPVREKYRYKEYSRHEKCNSGEK